MTGGVNCGGGTTHGYETTVVSLGCPLSTYIKEQGGRSAGPCRRARRRSPPPSRSRTSLFPTPTRRGKGRGRGRRKGGRRPPLLVQFGPEGEGPRGPPWPPLSLSPLGPIRPITSPRGGSGNPPALRFSPKPPGTDPLFEYSRPIYRYLCLDHFETPRHVRDHIRDFETTFSTSKTINSSNLNNQNEKKFIITKL